MKKKLAKQIEDIAGKMPLIMRSTHEKHIKKGTELLEDDIKELDGKPVDLERLYVVPMPVQIAINHKRTMKRLCKRHKGDRVVAYVNAVNNYQAKQKA